jgi:hypothetical protein
MEGSSEDEIPENTGFVFRVRGLTPGGDEEKAGSSHFVLTITCILLTSECLSRRRFPALQRKGH